MRATEKRLNEMNRLSDMLHFTAIVNAGATLNVLITVFVTWNITPFYPDMVGVWVLIVLTLNLLPVVILRRTIKPDTVYARLGEMDFVHDQHKFSDWVYLAASANMTFWILLTWTLSALHHTRGLLAAVEVVAFVATFSPVLLRGRSR